MEKIDNQIKSCTLCGNLAKLEKNSMQIGKTNLLILGESPAKDGWIESGKAFYNTKGKLQASGKILQKLLYLADLTIEDIYFTEVCKCLINDRKKLSISCENCSPILYEQITKIPCDIIMTMGLYTTQQLLKIKIKRFADYVGKQFQIEINGKKFILIPIYHPSPANPKGFVGNIEIFKNLKKLIHKKSCR